MVTYTICYEAENHYQHVVQEATFAFLVVPCENQSQVVRDISVENSLERPIFRMRNAYGYDAQCFRVSQPFTHLKFTATCTVDKQESTQLLEANCLPLAAEQQLLRSEEFLVDHYHHVSFTSLTELPADRIPTDWLIQRDQLMLTYLTQLNNRIYETMTYQAGATTFTTTAQDVIANPQGVCQDYTHLMLGVLRHQQIPCRYVSGYLNQGQDMMGSAQTHAWLEAFVPQLGWIGLDPTNNQLANEYHIKIADGRDYRDCSPLKGHIQPGGPIICIRDRARSARG